jgi:DNA-binding transcriptional ArsR family regulator
MAALPDTQPDLLDRLPDPQRVLLLALQAHGGPARARDLADATFTDRRAAAQRLEALAGLDLVIFRDADARRHRDQVRVYELSDTGRQLLAARASTPGPGPVVLATVLADRVRPASDRAREEIQRALRRAGDQLEAWMVSELTRVYVAGVSDGFAQGVAAEVTARTQEATHA